jgi:hypothetical protein
MWTNCCSSAELLARDGDPLLSQTEFSSPSTLFGNWIHCYLDDLKIQSQDWTIEAISQALSWLLVVLLQAELIVITWQVNSEH